MILTVTLDACIEKLYNITELNIGVENVAKKCTYDVGGKGIYISKLLTIVGEDVKATGFLGGHSGKIISEELKKWGIKEEFIEVSAENQINVNLINELKNEITKITEPAGCITLNNQESLILKYTSLLDNCTAVVISGNIPKGADCTLIQIMIQMAKEKK